MNATQRYELIRPILQNDKTPKQVHQETDVPLPTIYRHLKQFREGDGQIEALADKSSASHTHPNWFTKEQKSTVIAYKQKHPHKSSRQIARELTDKGILAISYHSVTNILKQQAAPHPPFSISLPNFPT